MLAVRIALFMLLLPFTASSVYLGALSCLAMLPGRSKRAAGRTLRRFAILVPARNEEQALPALLASLDAFDYPRDLVHTLVIADNCDDATAAIARERGFEACERADNEHRGKGYALAFGLTQLSGDHDAIVCIDGDCTVSPNLLRAFNDRLDSGQQVLQAYYNMNTSQDSSSAAVRSLALALVHLVRPLGKSRFGGSTGLKGSGMCFSREVIDRVGWNEFGLAEDIEQHLALLRAGLRVDFVREATVLGEAPSTLAGAQGQHSRWEAGRLSAARAEALPLLADGVRSRSMAKIDAAIELLIPPISVLAIVIGGLLPVAVALRSRSLITADAVAITALTLYVGSGFVVARTPPAEIARSLAAAPRFAIWKARLYLRALISKPAGWESTQRD